MTAREIVYNLQNQLHNLFGDLIYDIKTVDLLHYLNKAQNHIIKERIQEFEQNQYLTDILRTLVKDSTLTPITNSKGYDITLPEDYIMLVKHECTTVNSCGTKVVPGLLTQLDDIGRLLKDPFWKPIAEEPLYYITGNKIIYEILNSSFTITNSKITYIKRESPITISQVNGASDITSELPSVIHEEIITLARELIIADKQLNNK